MREAIAIVASAFSSGTFDSTAPRAWASDDLARLVLVAQAIDNWHAPLADPTATAVGMPEGMDDVKAHYNVTSRLNGTAGIGQVILRRPLWGRWSSSTDPVPDADGIGGLFETLLVLPAAVQASHPDNALEPITLRATFNLSRNRDSRALPTGVPWKVGFAPIAQEKTDIHFAIIPDTTHDWYDAQVTDLGPRIDEVIKELCSAGCHVIALPEMVLNPSMEQALKSAVRKYGAGSDLCLVLAGTTRTPSKIKGGMPSNRCVVIDHVGRTIVEQRKMSRWNLDENLCSRYDFTLAKGTVLKEYIEPGTELCIVERQGLGRLGVLVCEDLSRTEPGRWLRKHLLLDLQFTPVMDSDMRGNRWEKNQGKMSSTDGGCRVIVSNSIPFTHRQNASNAASGASSYVVDACGIGLMIDRDGPDVKALDVVVSLGDTGHCTAIVEWDPRSWSTIS